LATSLAGHPRITATGGQPAQAKGEKQKQRRPKFTISKETTYVTEPIDKDGYIDYATALNKRLSEGVTPVNNAKVLFIKALGPHPDPDAEPLPAEFFRWLGMGPLPERGDYYIDLLTYMVEHHKYDRSKAMELDDQQYRAMDRSWTAKEYPHLASWLKANEKPLALVVEGTKRPGYYSPLIPAKPKQGPVMLIGVIMSSVHKTRELAKALSARAMLHLGEGRYDQAWQDLLACHRLARLVSRGGSLIEGLTGNSLEAIVQYTSLAFVEHPRINSKQFQVALQDLHKLPKLDFAEKLNLFERFQCLDAVMMIIRSGANDWQGIGGLDKKANELARQHWDKINWDPALRSANRWFDRVTAAMRIKDRRSREKELKQLEMELEKLCANTKDPAKVTTALLLATDPPKALGSLLGDFLVCLLVPAFRKVQESWDRTEQQERNLHLAFALAAYQRDHGRYPAKLSELAPKYLAQLPDDVFSGKALIYRPAENGYLLYSVGVNGIDEGGRGDEDDPSGDDLCIRMPLPKLPQP
jgi:hypothetical protein